ncbi:MAG: FAD-dependent oxidoreductase [Victivallales bacterium]|nr:FAD-dependent oxidoreductase [Victivallales bacterium]
MNTNQKYDVTVVGGGVVGVVAAIQAGRAGASVLLIEKNAMLGGTATNGGVNFPGLFHACGQQVIAGIGWELIEKSVEGEMPNFAAQSETHTAKHVNVNIAMFAAACDAAVLESGADLMLHTMLADAKFADDHWNISICSKTGLSTVATKVLIDCTGDANVAEIAGFELIKPNICQPSTLSCHISGFDPDDLDYESLDNAFKTAVEDGVIQPEYACWRIDNPAVSSWIRSRGINANHISTTSDARGSVGRTSLEVESRKALKDLVSWLREQPGLENLSVDMVFPETGVRETAQIKGETVITYTDYISGKVWEDSLCHAFYPTDKHGMDSNEWEFHHLREDIVPTIPRGALIPRNSRFFMAAGRLISADRLAMSSLRVQGACMAMGQVAGAVSAISAKHSVTPSVTDLDEIKALLIEHKAIVP